MAELRAATPPSSGGKSSVYFYFVAFFHRTAVPLTLSLPRNRKARPAGRMYCTRTKNCKREKIKLFRLVAAMRKRRIIGRDEKKQNERSVCARSISGIAIELHVHFYEGTFFLRGMYFYFYLFFSTREYPALSLRSLRRVISYETRAHAIEHQPDISHPGEPARVIIFKNRLGSSLVSFFFSRRCALVSECVCVYLFSFVPDTRTLRGALDLSSFRNILAGSRAFRWRLPVLPHTCPRSGGRARGALSFPM